MIGALDILGVREYDMGVRVHVHLKYMLLYPGHISVSMEDTPVKSILHGSAHVHTYHQGNVDIRHRVDGKLCGLR